MSIHLNEISQNNPNQFSNKKVGFEFKQFFVAHDKSPMKVTTDSVLLGAWAPLDSCPHAILDIGTGCGVIALMLAQRLQHVNDVVIDAVDIDEQAVRQCQENSHNSPFTTVFTKQCDIASYLVNQASYQQYYDLIVCNPPYFEPAIACRNMQRQHARYTHHLSHTKLLECAFHLLSQEGQFCVVLPYRLVEKFVTLARQYQLHLMKNVSVRYSNQTGYSLSLLCFSKRKEKMIASEFCMRNEDASYTEAFRHLLQAFYIRF